MRCCKKKVQYKYTRNEERNGSGTTDGVGYVHTQILEARNPSAIFQFFFVVFLLFFHFLCTSTYKDSDKRALLGFVSLVKLRGEINRP